MTELNAQNAPDDVQGDNFDIYEELRLLLDGLNISVDHPAIRSITVEGRDPLVQSARIRYGAAAALPALGVAVIAAQLHYARSNQAISQHIKTDLRTAFHNHSIVSQHFVPTINGHFHNHALLQDNPFLHGIYQTADGRSCVPVAVYPRHKMSWYSLLAIPPTTDESIIEEAFMKKTSTEWISLANDAQLPFSIVQTAAEFIETQQGRILLNAHPCGALVKLTETPPKLFASCSTDSFAQDLQQPLTGVKVLMSTHAIAGPSAGRVLAEYGAEVLHIVRPGVGFEHEMIYNEANTGCRSTALDLSSAEDLSVFFGLIKDADIFIESFAPGAMARLGITSEILVKHNPNIIICSTKLFGLQGPLSEQKGHDQNASATVGVLHELGRQAESEEREGREVGPQWPEPSLVNDFTTGLFGAMGILACLLRRLTQGGAWQVSPSLAATCTWYLHKLPQVPERVFRKAINSQADCYSLRPPAIVEGPTPKGWYRRTGHIVQLDRTPLRWSAPLISIPGAGPPRFLKDDGNEEQSRKQPGRSATLSTRL